MTFIFHFCRCFGPKCGGCGEKIHYQDFVRKARDKVYHLRCFTCSLCSKQLSTGEVLYLQPGDEGFVCKDHYLKQGKKNVNSTWYYFRGARSDIPKKYYSGLVSVKHQNYIFSAMACKTFYLLKCNSKKY